MKQSLNDLFLNYDKKNSRRKELDGLVYQHLHKNRINRIFGGWTQDDYEDFISWFYPRLRKAIDDYRMILMTGKPENAADMSFETYIQRIMRISSKEYRLRKITKSVTEYSAWSAHVPELYAYETAPSYSYNMSNDIISRIITINKNRKSPKQIITLILKCYNYVSDDFLEDVSARTGINAQKLRAMLDVIRAKRQKIDDKNYHIRERVYCQFYRCMVYERRLSYLSENTAAYLKLKEKLIKARIRLENMRKRMAKLRTYASNREVSEVIGISKGAVDSCFFNLRAKLKTLSDKAEFN